MPDEHAQAEMQLRERILRLACHAPEEPAIWFSPDMTGVDTAEMPEPPKVGPSINPWVMQWIQTGAYKKNEPLLEFLKRYVDSDALNRADTDSLRDFGNLYQEGYRLNREYSLEKDRRRTMQWPIAWAIGVIQALDSFQDGEIDL